jgi:hypothetical protein
LVDEEEEGKRKKEIRALEFCVLKISSTSDLEKIGKIERNLLQTPPPLPLPASPMPRV